jgi:hypothetical protein
VTPDTVPLTAKLGGGPLLPPPPPPQLAIKPAAATARKAFPVVVMCDTLSPRREYFNATTPASSEYSPSAS